METILDTIRRHGRERGGDPVYWTPARTWTFAQLEDASNRIAQGLKSLGIGAGDRVACLTTLMMADAAFLYSRIRTFVTERFPDWYARFEARDPGHAPAPDDTALPPADHDPARKARSARSGSAACRT